MEELLKKMEALQESRDYEAAHVKADGLLCEALRLLGKQQGQCLPVARLLEAYHLIDKQYA